VRSTSYGHRENGECIGKSLEAVVDGMAVRNYCIYI
jgi:hypothetical protein